MESLVKVRKLIGFTVPVTWIATGHGHSNGYVALPPGHPFHGLHYDKLDQLGVSCHGGLTFSELFHDGTWSNTPHEHCVPKGLEGWWVIGFDTCHPGDSLERWPLEEVVNEIQYVIDQINALCGV